MDNKQKTTTMTTTKGLSAYLISKVDGYIYEKGDARVEIKRRERRGWYTDTIYKGHLVDSYGHDDQTLAQCKYDALRFLQSK